MENVALYGRVSTEEQVRHGLSLTEQERSLEQFAKSKNYIIYGKYFDAGISARKSYTKRPQLMRLLEDVKKKHIDIILFTKLDRWFRNVGNYYEVQKILDENAVTWQATQEDYETITASGRLKVNIMLSVAQDEADRTSERIKFIVDAKKARNEAVCYRTPKGYKIENKKVVIDKETEPYIKKVFETYMETGSPGKVIEAVPELNLNYKSLDRLLRSTAYIGDFHGIEVQPYINEKQFQTIQGMKKQFVRKSPVNRVYLFSGLIICPDCGSHMTGFYTKYKTIYRQRYRCTKYVNKGGCGFSSGASEKYIEAYLLDHIESKAQLMITAKKDTVKPSHEKEISEIKKKLSNLADLYVNGLISMKDYKAKYTALTNALNDIPEDTQEPDVEGIKKRFFKDWKEMYHELPAKGKQEFWHSSLKSISLNPDGTVKDFIFR